MDRQPDYLVVRTGSYMRNDIPRIEGHNERKNEHYTNYDVVPERKGQNVYFKRCEESYLDVFDAREGAGVFSTRGLKAGAIIMDEFLIDVNSEYFLRHGEDYAHAFFGTAYQYCVEMAGGEQNIISAVMHADERNVALSEKYGFDVWHYHMHVVYVPVVAKEIKYTKRWKDKEMRGKVRETIMQVSHSKKWISEPLRNEQGQVRRDSKGSILYDYSYSKLQTEFFAYMQAHEYTNLTRGEVGSKRKRRETADYKLEQDELRAEEATQKVNALTVIASQKYEELRDIAAEATYYQEAIDSGRAELSEIKDISEYLDFATKCRAIVHGIFDKLSVFLTRNGVLRDKKEERSLSEVINAGLLQLVKLLSQLCGYEYREAIPPEECESVKITATLTEQIAVANATKVSVNAVMGSRASMPEQVR